MTVAPRPLRIAHRPDGHAHPRRHRRRDRLCRPGARPHSRAPSGGHAHGRDVVGRGQRAAAAAGAQPHLGGHGDAARRRSARSASADVGVPGAARGRRRPSSRRNCSSAAFASSTCRVPSGSAPRPDRQKWYPATAALPGGTVYGMTEGHRLDQRTRVWCPTPGAIPRRRCSRSNRWPRPACSKAASWSTRSRASRAPARRPPIARTSPRITAASPPTASSPTATSPRSSRSSPCR